MSPPPQTQDDAWFRENVLPHEGMLRAWLRSQFPGEGDVDDVVQEAFIRILGASDRAGIASPKAFLFATARNLVVSRIRKRARRGVFSLADLDETGVLDDTQDVQSAVSRAEEMEFLTEAIQSLPDRCRQIITLRKIYGMSQKEIARELGISENTVESQGTIGMRKLARYFEALGRNRGKRHD